ncbi:hypothetical protein [[Eubacterium] cellulosolvens]
MKLDKEPRLQGTVVEISKTGEKTQDEDGLSWERCLFTIALEGYSKRTPDLTLPPELVGKKIKITRYCAYDWHLKLNVTKTLTPPETQLVLNGKTDLTE